MLKRIFWMLLSKENGPGRDGSRLGRDHDRPDYYGWAVLRTGPERAMSPARTVRAI